MKHCGLLNLPQVWVEWKHQTIVYSKIGQLRTMSASNDDSLVFRVVTDEYVFEQWDLVGPVARETAQPKTI